MAKNKDISQAVREICLWFPETEEVMSHGSPDFRVKGKTFATYAINHHGDGRVALWLNAPRGAQAHYVQEEPKHFFVPPYVGPRGWLGVNLDKGISWKAVARLVREAYEKVAPPALTRSLGKTIEITPPTAKLKPEDIDPLQSKRAQTVLEELRAICLSLPETSESKQFGNPVWRAGKKVFAQAYCYRSDLKLTLAFWVGVDQQALLIRDQHFSIPPYIGHNGWIALDVTKDANWREIRSLALFSYRHFALARMLKVLDAGGEPAGAALKKTAGRARKKAAR
ncbi:MmcQ/YjbR family DNA-binding protein [Steroidobacter sp. S1-65]|uniref:MmcQ/YjbR family DNA-binding protein n=1 Tax=Steroidobacter gossypii TaxID=2805490 RepID=A0ABS1WV09_9GAMM|nr:MmcQ/YjbR family DNA-binding protein [Steroidobacter gossypii]MBM0104809.1 MmcQ/YjbR family DNA-binding protein [Steroidobacter gossypii]